MEEFLVRRAARQRAHARTQASFSWLNARSTALQASLLEQTQSAQRLRDRAATRIQSLVRGGLERLVVAELKAREWAAIVFQKWARGAMGRRVAVDKRWQTLRVVPSAYALKLMRLRSREVDNVGSWAEMFDPMTNTFWYMDKEKQSFGINNSCWDHPPCFDDKLTCVWEPSDYPARPPLPKSLPLLLPPSSSTSSSSPLPSLKSAAAAPFPPAPAARPLALTNRPCCKTFATRRLYNSHRLTCHKWVCTACEAINTGLTFPRCFICDNVRNGEGDSLFGKLKNDVNRALMDMHKKEGAPNLRGGRSRKKVLHRTRNGDEADFADPAAGSDSDSAGEHSDGENTLSSLEDNVDDFLAVEDSVDDGFGAGLPTLGPDAGVKRFEVDAKLKKEEAAAKKERERKGLDKLPSLGTYDPSRTQLYLPPAKRSTDPSHPSSFDMSVGGSSFSHASSPPLPPPWSATLKVDVKDCRHEAIMLCGIIQESRTQYLSVCRGFTKGNCSLSTCPRAHPGLRDDAELFPVEGKGKRGCFYVKVCFDALLTNECPNGGRRCNMYHPYVRPSTKDIILKVYPKRNGMRQHSLPSGLVVSGPVTNEVFDGYCVMEWEDGDVYTGNVTDGYRNGLGIWRSSDGKKEYLGQWVMGHRDGWGCLTHPNGESYTGQFVRGKMEGVGELTSSNGDVYKGHFKNGKYDNVGMFQKSNGDLYIGYSKDGEADGLGILIYASGEKYKGYFKKNKRCGRGVCIYPNKSRYSGMWADGFHDGFGIYVTQDNACYAGQWRRGKKDGAGRYYFQNGDFYDGLFADNHASGHGVYRHGDSGNVYVGMWKESARHGVGSYYFANKSFYNGYWYENDIHGKGIFEFANGARYAGEFKKNLKHGKGIFTWNTGNKYSGQFFDDKLCGVGEMIYIAGHSYRGEWKNNKKNGRGVFKYADGNIYDGYFVDDVINGKGKMRYLPDTILEESYNGDWVDGMRHGLGKYVYKEGEGNVYEGEWHKGLRNGKGILRFKDGSFYKGDFKKERMTGVGIYVWPDGSQYEGSFLNNVRHGTGTHLTAQGVIFTGSFNNGKKHGPGKVVYLDGNSYVGEWVNDVVIGRGSFELHATEEDSDVVRLKVFGF